MNKSILILIVSLFLLFSGCQSQKTIIDLKKEAEYAQKQGSVFAVDLLQPEGDSYVMGGWSKVRKDGTRLGVYPVSRINIPVYKKESVYLFFKCQPIDWDRIPAEGFRIRMRSKEIARVGLSQGIESLIKIAIDPDVLELGDNVLQIQHVINREDERKIGEEEQKRIRTAIFQEIILSSHPDYELAKRIVDLRKAAASTSPDILIQKVPSTFDFYVDIAAGARLDAEFEFIAADPSGPEVPGGITISIKQREKREEIIFQTPIDSEGAKGKVEIDLPVERNIARLRLQAGKSEERELFEGLLIWKEASVSMKREKAVEETKMNADFMNWKKSLADKNTVIILLDAARADRFSCYGYFRPTTPNLDRFAEDAVMFTQVFSEGLTTRVSIGTLFTGFPLTVLSMYGIASQIPEELTTLAQLFRQKNIKTTGFAGVVNAGSPFGFDRGFDQYFELYREEGFYRKSQEYLPYLFPWLEANKDNKFFLYVHFKEPHAAYSPLPPFKGMFTGQYEETIDLSVNLNPVADTLTDGQIEYIRAGYDENLASVDSVVGEIIEKMGSLGTLEESIVIVTADHGELLGEKDKIFGHGGYFGEGGMHIPLFIRFPKSEDVDFPDRVHALVKTSDLFVTLADIYGFEITGELFSGKSLLPLIKEPESEINTYMVSEKRGIPGYCYRNKRYKLIYWMENAPLEFYELENDPDAMNNVYEQNTIVANYYLVNLTKWIMSQKLIKNTLLKGDPAKMDLDIKQLDEKTLENLKALGYIK